MSNNIYDILGKLNGLAPKENPVSTAEPVYESLDPRGDIMEAVTGLEKKYAAFNENIVAEKKKRKSAEKIKQPDAGDITSADATINQLLTKARFSRPGAKNDLEAIVYHIAKQDEELERAKAAEEEDRMLIKKAQAVTDQMNDRFKKLNAKVAAGQITAQDQSQAQAAQQIEKDTDAAKAAIAADPTAPIQQIADPEIKTQKAPAPVASKTEPKANNIYNFPTKEPAPVQAVAPAKNVTSIKRKSTAGDTGVGDTGFASTAAMLQQQPAAIPQAVQPSKQSDNVTDVDFSKLTNVIPQQFRQVRQAAESIQEYDGDNTEPVTGDGQKNAMKIANFMADHTQYQAALKYPGEAPAEWRNPPPPAVKLDFANGRTLNLSLANVVKLLQSLTKRVVTAKDKDNFFNYTLADADQLLAYIANVNRPQTKRPPMKKGQTLDMFATDTAQQKSPGFSFDLPQGSRGTELEENLGNPSMKNLEQVAESLMEKYMGFKKTVAAIKKGDSAENPEAVAAAIGRKKYGKKAFQKAAATGKKLGEAAKPDFLDLDKDGNTDEPMKSAAKSAKKHEPADIDKDAVAKRKRLQALKDKQEDERAEKGDDHKSASRFVKGRAYGGSAQKDDEDKDLDESGLQAYLGKKKYGKEGMKALQQAGRDGASKEKMAMLRAKHDKMDEARPSRADKVTKDLTSIADKKGYKSAKDFTKADWNKVAKPHGYTGKEIAAVRGHKVEEVARRADKVTKDLTSIADKKGYKSAKDFTRQDWDKVAKPHGYTGKEIAAVRGQKLKESRNAESSEYTYETIGRVLCDEQPHLDANSEAFVKAVYDELIEMKLTPKAARWLVNYDQDFLSDCATSYGHFCASKEKEAMECGAPMNSFVSEQPTIDAVQELDEIARLAGLTREDYNPMVPGDSASPLTYAGCSKCNADPCCCEDEKAMDEGMGCSEDELNEAATRKDFRMVADLLKSIPDMAKRTELAMYHADIFKQQNPRFKKEMFLAAAGVDTTPIKDVEDEVLVGEAEVGEGNEFSGALAKAKAAGEKEFEVDGKKYTVKEDININVTANGEEDVINLIRKLSGMEAIKTVTDKLSAMSGEACGACGSSPCGCESLEEDSPMERDVEYTNTPREQVAGTDAAIAAGADLNRAKRQYKKEYPGDNPMAVKEAIQNMLWNDYQSMINDVKA